MASTGLREVTVTWGDSSAELTVATAERDSTITFVLTSPVAIEITEERSGVRRDRTAAPAATIAAAFDGEAGDSLVAVVTEELADWAVRTVDLAVRHPDPAEQLLVAGHPLLRQLAEREDFTIGSAVPAEFSPLLRVSTPRRAAELLVDADDVTRDVVRAVAASVDGGGHLRLREWSLTPLAAGLEATDVVHVLEARPDTPAPEAVVSRAAAERCSSVLQRLGRQVHRRALAQIVERTGALSVCRIIAEADAAGALDISGIRGDDPRGWLLERSREALAQPAATESPLAVLHGAELSTACRLRVAHRVDELRHLGSSMANCLGSYGRAALARGMVIIGVVSADGRAEQALEVAPDGTVTQWYGPRNAAVAQRDREPVIAAAAHSGIELKAHPAMLDDTPF